VIRSTIEDLLLEYGKLTPEKDVKNIEWTFSTDSLLIITVTDPVNTDPFRRKIAVHNIMDWLCR